MENTELPNDRDDIADATLNVVDCAGHQDISNVQDLQQRLQAALDLGAPVTLDGSETERLDTAAAQLLYAFVQAAGERGMAVSWQAPTEAVTNTARLLGMHHALGLAAS